MIFRAIFVEPSGENIMHNVAVHIRKPEIATSMFVGQSLVIQP
jgi:hypothetical protein